MQLDFYRPDLPVLLLYNIDPSWPVEDIQGCIDATHSLSSALLEVGHPVEEVCLNTTNLQETLAPYRADEHLVFNCCEEIPGIPHSEAQVAVELERLGFTFTGADSRALAHSQDKRWVKEWLHTNRIPTPMWRIFESAQPNGWDCYPAIVKPAFEHCSLGITHEAVVHSPAELLRRVSYVLDTFHQPVIVEDFIDGREFSVSVIGNGELRVLPIAEIDFSVFQDVNSRLCTYESKFNPASPDYTLIELRLPALLTAVEQRSLEAVSKATYRLTDCRDYARLDIRLRDGVFYVLDVNPNADLCTDTSLVLAAKLVGLSYGKLGSLLVNLAAHRCSTFITGSHAQGSPSI